MNIKEIVQKIDDLDNFFMKRSPERTLANRPKKRDSRFEPNHMYGNGCMFEGPYAVRPTSKNQQVSQSNQTLPLKQEQEPRRIKSYRLLKLGVKNSCDSKFSELDSHISNKQVRDKSGDSGARSCFNLSIKKTQLNRSKTPNKLEPCVQSPNIYKRFSLALTDEFIMIEVFKPPCSPEDVKDFSSLIKKRSLVRNDPKSTQSASDAKLKVSEETNCLSEELKNKDDAHNIYAKADKKIKPKTKVPVGSSKKITALVGTPRKTAKVDNTQLLASMYKPRKTY